MDHHLPLELLESTHVFPGVYQIKAIGSVADDFASRVVGAVREELGGASDLDYSSRTTPDGRHVSLTLHVTVQSAEQVRSIYARVRELEGLKLLL